MRSQSCPVRLVVFVFLCYSLGSLLGIFFVQALDGSACDPHTFVSWTFSTRRFPPRLRPGKRVFPHKLSNILVVLCPSVSGREHTHRIPSVHTSFLCRTVLSFSLLLCPVHSVIVHFITGCTYTPMLQCLCTPVCLSPLT